MKDQKLFQWQWIALCFRLRTLSKTARTMPEWVTASASAIAEAFLDQLVTGWAEKSILLELFLLCTILKGKLPCCSGNLSNDRKSRYILAERNPEWGFSGRFAAQKETTRAVNFHDQLTVLMTSYPHYPLATGFKRPPEEPSSCSSVHFPY